MEFSTPLFLFLFLPIFIFLHSIVNKRLRNILALLASILFYAIGYLAFLPLILLSILFNYGLGILIDNHACNKKGNPQIFLISGVVINIGLLLVFKFLAQYADVLSLNLYPDLIDEIVVPLGLSYITFQNISYLVDIDHRRIKAEKNLIDFSLFILLFPKLLAGPIVLYQLVELNFPKKTGHIVKSKNGI